MLNSGVKYTMGNIGMRKRPLHVVMISAIFYPKVNGYVIAITNLLKCLQEHGCKVRLITRKLPGTLPIEGWQNIPVIRVGPDSKLPLSRLVLSWNQVRAGISLMKKEHIDIIHAHGVHSLLAGLILSKIFHKPVVATFHGFQRLWFKSARWKPELNLALTHPIHKILVNSADVIIAQSQTLKKVIFQLYGIDPEKIQVIPHAIDETRFKFVPTPSSAEPTVLFVGSLMRVHGVDLLVKAAPTILKDFPETKFIIIGDGPQKETLQRLIESLKLKKSVFLIGPVYNQSALIKYYSSASVVVIPIKYRGYILSLVALEAMSTGRPVVTTMTLDPDLGKYGVRKAGFNPAELAQAIKEILSLNEEEYSKLAASARKYVEERCSKKIVASKIENVYRQLIETF